MSLTGRSLRLRLLLWMAIVQVVIVGGFAVLLYHEVRRSRLVEFDAELATAVAGLEGVLQGVPRWELLRGIERLPLPDQRGRHHGDDRDRRGRPNQRGLGDRFPKDRPPWRGKGPPPDHPPLRPGEVSIPPGPGTPEMYFAVWRGNGSLINADGVSENRPRPEPTSPGPPRRAPGPNREIVVPGPWGTVILVGRPTGRLYGELHRFAWLLVAVGGGALAVGLVGGWIVSRRIFRPINTIAAIASRISGTNLAERIDPRQVDVEMVGLAEVLNSAFDRLQAALERQTRFTSDASHELRTPLSVLRSHAELALARPRTPEEYQATLATCIASTQRMTDLVERLLTLARADEGWTDLEREVVALDELAEQLVREYQPLAVQRKVQLTSQTQSVEVLGDAAALGQVLANLITNAVQYNQPGGTVRVQVTARGEQACVRVEDDGIGIPEAEQPLIFERFYRVDKSRSRSVGGTGLGLAICQEIVQAHGGELTLTSTPGQGSVFSVELPRLAT